MRTQTREGELAEWSNAAVLKTVLPKGNGGSNPSFSAKVIKELHESVALFFVSIAIRLVDHSLVFKPQYETEQPFKCLNLLCCFVILQ